MEHERYVPFPFQRAIIPEGEILRAEILGVDDGSFFYITFCDPRVQAQYNQMLEKMRCCVRGRYCMPIRLSMRPGTDCIVEYPGRRGGVYTRGKTIGLIPGTDLIRCELIDDVLEIKVHRTQIYHSGFDVLDIPKFVLKCKLKNMDCFVGHPYLKLLYLQAKKAEWKPDSNLCTVKIIDKGNPIPTVKLMTTEGKNLSDVLQQYIPTFQRLEYPDFGVPTAVKICHCDEKGNVWYQPMDSKNLMGVIKSRLWLYNDGHLMLKPEKNCPKSEEVSWKDHFFKGPGEIFIYKTVDNRRSYRVRELCRNGDGTVLAFYVDYGNTDAIREDRMVPARLVDPNLCLIPPQCLPVRFIGADCTDDDVKCFNLRKFWKYVMHQRVSIEVKECSVSAGMDFPNYLVKDRIIPAYCLDANLCFLPPPCVPVKFLGNGLGFITQQFSLDGFWAHSRNMPVPAVLESYNSQIEHIGTFQGGVIPPNADILVHLPNSASPQNQRGVSLYEIYHKMEFCNVHGPSVVWDDIKTDTVDSLISEKEDANLNYVKEEMKGLAIDDNNNIVDSSSDFCKFDNENHDNWVDWVANAIRSDGDGEEIPLFTAKSGILMSSTFREDENNNWITEKDCM